MIPLWALEPDCLVPNPDLPFVSCAILGKLLDVSVLYFLPQYDGDDNVSAKELL